MLFQRSLPVTLQRGKNETEAGHQTKQQRIQHKLARALRPEHSIHRHTQKHNLSRRHQSIQRGSEHYPNHTSPTCRPHKTNHTHPLPHHHTLSNPPRNKSIRRAMKHYPNHPPPTCRPHKAKHTHPVPHPHPLSHPSPNDRTPPLTNRTPPRANAQALLSHVHSQAPTDPTNAAPQHSQPKTPG